MWTRSTTTSTSPPRSTTYSPKARGYRLSLALAHQHLAQLPRDLREGISANARTKVYFQLSADDANALDRDVQPELSRHDLAHLPQYTTAVRLCHSGQTTRAFTLTTEPLPPADDAGRADQVRRHVRDRLGDQPDVDAVLERRRGGHPLQRRQREPSPPAPPAAPPVAPPVRNGAPSTAPISRADGESRGAIDTRQGGQEA